MLKNFIKKILKIFGLSIHRNKKNLTLVNLNDWTPYKNLNNFYKLYYDGLQKTREPELDLFPKQLRLFSLYQLAIEVIKNKIPGDFAEIGCWKGHSTYLISRIIKNKNKKIMFHIFDSFEGLSVSDKRDEYFFNQSEQYKRKLTEHFISSEVFLRDKVLHNFKFTKIYKGWIPKRFKEVKNKKFCFVHIDVDLFFPTYESLNFFFPRLRKGGVIICDDYNSSQFPGAKKAWQKYFSKKQKNYSFFYEQPFGGCFLIK